MTIKRKNIRSNGLLEVEADNTDTVDTNGFSDPISIVSAITAKYSDTSIIQAPPGLRVGTTQIKIVAGAEGLPAQILISSDWTGGANIVDGDLNTQSGTLVQVTLPTVMEVIVDFGSIASRNIGAKFNIAQPGNLSVTLFTQMISRIFVSDTLTFGAETSTQSNTVQGTNTGPQNKDFNHNTGPISFRYVKFTLEQGTTNNPNGQRAGNCFVYEVNIGLVASSDAVVNIRASDTINTADGIVLNGPLNISPGSTTILDSDLILVESQKFLTLDIATVGGNSFDINLSEITSITEVNL